MNGTAAFNALFDLVVKKAALMNYWKGEKNSKSKTNEKFEAYSKRLNVILSQRCEDNGSSRRGPPRKLTLKQLHGSNLQPPALSEVNALIPFRVELLGYCTLLSKIEVVFVSGGRTLWHEYVDFDFHRLDL